MPPRVRLFSMPISHYCVSAERMLAFKGIAFEYVGVPYHDKRALIAATGQDYVPALLWDGRVVTWREIPRFLDSVRPEPRLLPPGLAGEAEVVQNWAHQVLEERVWRAVVTRVPRVLRAGPEAWVFEEMQTRARGPWHVLEARAPEFRAEMVEHLAMVDRMLDGREWLLGTPSVADCAVFGAVSPLLTTGGSLPAGLRRLGAWHRRVAALGRGSRVSRRRPPRRRRTRSAGAGRSRREPR